MSDGNPDNVTEAFSLRFDNGGFFSNLFLYNSRFDSLGSLFSCSTP